MRLLKYSEGNCKGNWFPVVGKDEIKDLSKDKLFSYYYQRSVSFICSYY